MPPVRVAIPAARSRAATAAGLIFAGSAGPEVLGGLLARHRRAVEQELDRLLAERERGERAGYLRPEVSPLQAAASGAASCALAPSWPGTRSGTRSSARCHGRGRDRLARGRASASPGRIIAVCVAAAAAALAAVPITPWLPVAFVLLTLGSVAVSAAQVHTLTRLQQLTTDDVRGAVGGLTAITMSGFAGVAAATMALTAAGTGPAPVIAIVAAATMVTGLTVRAERAGTVRGRLRSTQRDGGRPGSTGLIDRATG
jgi:hypothetical protein